MRHGQQCGCTDQAPSEVYTDYQLSRLADIFKLALEIDKNFALQMWEFFPTSIKLEFNYSNWKYQERRADA
jgi:hypothetical protein